jgi:hypothetical protein
MPVFKIKNKDGSWQEVAGVSGHSHSVSQIVDFPDMGEFATEEYVDGKISTEKSERKAEIAVERARINTFTALAEGSTTGDAELQDIRVGYDGTEYETAGEAIRQQVEEVVSKPTTLEILDYDPPISELSEGRMWILKSAQLDSQLSAPVISLDDIGNNNIKFSLSNASYDESGLSTNRYNVYLNGVLYSVVAINPASIYTITGLDYNTTYTVSIRGIKDGVLSEQSNVLSVTTHDEYYVDDVTNIVYIVRSSVRQGDAAFLYIMPYNERMCAVSNNSQYPITDTYYNQKYYLIPVPETATSVTVTCDGLMYGYSGWNPIEDDIYNLDSYSYNVDSGWLNSGTTYSFNAGVAKCCNLAFKMIDNSAFPSDFDTSSITIEFA